MTIEQFRTLAIEAFVAEVGAQVRRHDALLEFARFCAYVGHDDLADRCLTAAARVRAAIRGRVGG